MPIDPTPIVAWLSVAALSVGLLGTVAALVVRPMLRGLIDEAVAEPRDAIQRIESAIEYHLEPNGDEDDEARRLRRPARSIALKAEHDVGVIKDRQANDYEWRQEHDVLHARRGLE